MRKRSAPGARMKRSSTLVSHTTTSTTSTRAIRSCSSGVQSNSRKASERAQRERGDPSQAEGEPPADRAQPRLDGVQLHRDQPLAKAGGHVPVGAHDRPSPVPRTRESAGRPANRPASRSRDRAARRLAVSSDAAVGRAPSEARICWRTISTGAVISAIGIAAGAASAGLAAVCCPASQARTSGSSISESRARTFSGRARELARGAGSCARAATGAISSNTRPRSAMTIDPGTDIGWKMPASRFAQGRATTSSPAPPPVHSASARTCRTEIGTAPAMRQTVLETRSGGSACRVWGPVL